MKRSLPIIALAVGLLLALFGLAWQIRAERTALLDRFASEREAAVAEASRRLSDSLGDIRDNLRLAGEFISTPGDVALHERELRAFLEAVPQFKTMAVIGRDGPRLVVTDRRAPQPMQRGVFLPDLVGAGTRALDAGPGTVVTSPVLASDSSGWLRVFSASVRSGEELLAVAVLVDTEPYFAPLQLAATPPAGKLLVVGPHGKITVASDRGLAALAEDASRREAIDGIVERMRTQAGVERLSTETAARLGVKGEVVIVFRPVNASQMAPWGVAAVFPTEPLRANEQSLLVRFGLAAVLITVFVAALALYVLAGQRRAAALRETQARAEHLAKLHTRTQKILDGMPTMVAALSADGRVVSFNRSLLASEPQMDVGRPLSAALPRASPQALTQLESLLRAATSDGEPASALARELELFGEAGTYSLHIVPLESGTDVGALLVIEDLSDVRALQTQLLRAEKLATVGILAAGIAHEIGTPLGIVRGRAEYMQGKSDARDEGLNVIISQIDRVTRTLQQLLDFAQLRPASVKSTALAEVVAQGSALLAVEANRRKVKLQTEIPPGLPPLAADPDQLQQVLLNLVLNAAQACEPGGEVRVQAEAASPSSVRLSVTDDGCGIPPELLHRVFDPFFTTKKRGQGSGLGLTVVAQIVRNHGGRIEIASEPGKGTRVSMDWPASSEGTEAHA